MFTFPPNVLRYAAGGLAFVTLLILVYGQIASGASFPVVRFRETQPKEFWAVVGAYALLLLAIVILMER
jgi:hypothetical protein